MFLYRKFSHFPAYIIPRALFSFLKIANQPFSFYFCHIMKKTTKYLTILLFLLFAMTGCSENEGSGEEWDIAGLYLTFDIVDTQGESLLRQGTPGSVYGQPISLSYENKEYTLDWNSSRGEDLSRAYLAIFNGLQYIPLRVWNPATNHWDETDGRIIRIGELPRDSNYEKSMTLHFGGKNYTIRVVNSIKWIDRPAGSDYDPAIEKVPDITTTVWLDGKQLEGTYFTITI